MEFREFVIVHQTFIGAIGKSQFQSGFGTGDALLPDHRRGIRLVLCMTIGSFWGTIIATMLSYLHREVYTLVITANVIDGLIAETETAMKGDSDQPPLFTSPAEMLKLDRREFNCNSWHLEPTIRCGWLYVDISHLQIW